MRVPQYGTNNLTLWTKAVQYNTGLLLYQDTSTNLGVAIASDKAVIVNPDTSKFHIVIAQGAELKLYVDGLSASASTNTADISAATAPIDMLLGNGGPSFEVAEILAVKGTVSSGDVANLQNYWKQKFKL